MFFYQPFICLSRIGKHTERNSAMNHRLMRAALTDGTVANILTGAES